MLGGKDHSLLPPSLKRSLFRSLNCRYAARPSDEVGKRERPVDTVVGVDESVLTGCADTWTLGLRRPLSSRGEGVTAAVPKQTA